MLLIFHAGPTTRWVLGDNSTPIFLLDNNQNYTLKES